MTAPNELETRFNEFIETKYFDVSYTNVTNKIRRVVASESAISWSFIQRKIIEYGDKSRWEKYMILWTWFAIELDKLGLLEGELKGLFALNDYAVGYFVRTTFNNRREILTSCDFTPTSLFEPPYMRDSASKYATRVIHIPGLTLESSELLKRYLSTMTEKTVETRFDNGIHIVFLTMPKSINSHLNLHEYSDSTFLEHFNLINEHICKKENVDKKYRYRAPFAELIGLYIWIQNEIDEETRNKNFKKFTLQVLKYFYLTAFLKEGYEVVNYSIYDNPPEADKWIINPQNSSLHQTSRSHKITTMDFSIIKNKKLREWIKECFWYDNSHNISNRAKEYSPILKLLLNIDKKYNEDDMPFIGVDDILSYKAECVSKDVTEGVVARKLSFVKYFLNYISDKQYINVDQLLFRLLTHHNGESTPYKETYTQEEIHSLLAAYKDSYETCEQHESKFLYTLYYYIIAIQSISEMRVSTILNLKTDCLVKTLERKDYSEYKVVVASKISGREQDEYNITKYVKGLIDEVIAFTAELREQVIGIEKEFLFIYPRNNRKLVGIVQQEDMRKYHRKICDKYGIRYRRPGAIRNYYQQQVSDYVAKNGDDPMLIERLSKHGINVHLQHYDKVDIKDFCQQFYQVEIGSIHLKGRIEETNNMPKENDVNRGCGHCSMPQCVLKGNLECLMCDKFVTTLDCIPFFEKEIEAIDEMILKQPIKHEKEFLNNKKRLNVAYLTKLYELEEEVNGSNELS